MLANIGRITGCDARLGFPRKRHAIGAVAHFQNTGGLDAAEHRPCLRWREQRQPKGCARQQAAGQTKMHK